jgi:hypothetical protein
MIVLPRWSPFIGLLLLLADSGSGRAQDYLFEKEPARHALVIGNAAYIYLGPLPSAKLDAEQTAERLRALGFDVTPVSDLASVRDFEDDILPAFRRKIEPGDLVLFYFSGHGFAHGPHNFLAPIDMPLSLRERDVAEAAISVESLEDYFARRAPGLVLFLIDACRTIGGFIIANQNNDNVVAKGPAEPKQFHRGMNMLIGYATRPGMIAQGSAAAAELSPFTKSLVFYIDKEGFEFGTLFNDISADVRLATDEMQQPGIFDWSDSELYLHLKSSNPILAQQKEVWLAALDSHKWQNVLRYSYRFSVSRHAAAARKWLADNPPTAQAPRFTLASPAAVERAWRPTEQPRVAISPTIAGFAFERSLAPQAGEAVRALDDRQLGLVPSGTKASAATPSQIARELQVIEAHGTVVTTKDYVARTAPSPSAPVASRLPFGTRVQVSGVEDRAAEGTWLSAKVPGADQVVFLPVQPADKSRAPIELGRALLEIVAPPRATGVRDLVEPGGIDSAITALKAAGRTITWVSIAAAPADDRKEADARAARLTHVEYLLKQAGIDGRRITAVANADDVSGNGVRLRFFGF